VRSFVAALLRMTRARYFCFVKVARFAEGGEWRGCGARAHGPQAVVLFFDPGPRAILKSFQRLQNLRPV